MTDPGRHTPAPSRTRRRVLRAAVLLPLAGAVGCSRTEDAGRATPTTGRPPPPPASPEPLQPPQPPQPTRTALPPGELVHAATGRPQVALTFHGDGDLAL